MYKGTLWLDYQDEEDEGHYQATIDECIIRDKKITFTFKGYDGEEGYYSGICTAYKIDNKYSGSGEFRYSDGTICKAQVSLTFGNNGNGVSLSGLWVDNKYLDSPYELWAELNEAK